MSMSSAGPIHTFLRDGPGDPLKQRYRCGKVIYFLRELATEEWDRYTVWPTTNLVCEEPFLGFGDVVEDLHHNVAVASEFFAEFVDVVVTEAVNEGDMSAGEQFAEVIGH
jgi:hypothetical protein